MISQIITLIANGLKSLFTIHKGKIFLIFFSAFVFFILLFPYSNLGGWLSSQISLATRGKVSLVVEKMGLQSWPLGLRLKNVSVVTAYAPALKVDEVVLAPTLSLYGGASVFMKGFLKGEVEMFYENGSKVPNSSGKRMKNIEGVLKKLSLLELLSFAEIQLPIEGGFSGKFKASIDPSFKKDIKGDLSFLIQNFKLSSSTFLTPLGEMVLPSILWKQVKLNGKMVKDEFVISEFVFGDAGASLSGRLKGQFVLKLSSFGGVVKPKIGAYSFNLELQAKKPVSKELASFFGLLNQFKTESASRLIYRLKISGSRLGSLPQMSRISQL